MSLTVQDVMTQRVVAIHCEDNVDVAFATLLRHNVSGLPVLDSDEHVVGVLSELDLMRLLYNPETTKNRVIDYATRDVITVRKDDALPEVAELFLTRPIRRLPVVDDDNRLIGVVSRRDLIRFIREIRIKVAAVLDKRRDEDQSAAEPAAAT